MKKRIFSLFFVLSLIFPMFMLTACKDKDPIVSGITVEFDDESQTVDYVVNEKTITTTYNPSASYALDAEDFVVTLKYSDETTKTLTAADANLFTFTSTVPTTITNGVVPAGSYTLTFAAGSISETFTFVVNKATIDMSDVTWGSNMVYDGTEKTTVLSGLEDLSATVTASYTGNTATNAGTYNAVATLEYDSANYVLENVPTLEKEWTIEKGTITLSNIWNYNASNKPVYNATAHSVSVLANALPEGVSVESYTGTTNATNAGTYTAGVVFAQTPENLANWNAIDSTAYGISWEIEKATIDLSAAAWQTTTSFTYDGTAKSVAIVGLDSKVTANYANGTKTDAGSYNAVATLVYDSANYVLENIPTLEQAWTIEKATLSLANASWTGAEETLVYDGTAKTVTFNDSQIGGAIISVQYEGNTATDAGSYTATAILHYNSSNYDLPADTSVLTYTWTIEKAEYNMPTITWNYTEPFVYDGTEKTVVITNNNLPEGVSIASYANNTGTEKGTYVAYVTFTQDTTNYELIDASKYDFTWKIVAEECITVSFDENNWTQVQFEDLRYLPFGTVLVLEPLADYRIEYKGNTYYSGNQLTIEANDINDVHDIVVYKNDDEILSKHLDVKYFDMISIDNEAYVIDDDTIYVELSSASASAIKLTLGNDTVTGQSYISKYPGLTYCVNYQGETEITEDNINIPVENYDDLTLYYQGMWIATFRIVEYSPIERIEYRKVEFDGLETVDYAHRDSGYRFVVDNQFITSFSVAFKEGYEDCTYVIVNEDSKTVITNDKLTNANVLDGTVYIYVFDDEGNEIFDTHFSIHHHPQFGFNIDSWSANDNIYYTTTSNNNLTAALNSKYLIDGETSVEYDDYGVYYHEVTTSVVYNEKTYTVTYPFIVNYSPAIETYIEDIMFVNSEFYAYYEWNNKTIDGIGADDFAKFDINTQMQETLVDGWAIESKELIKDKIAFIKYTFVSTADANVKATSYIWIKLDFFIDNNTNIASAVLYSKESPNGANVEISENTINLENMNSLNTLDIITENRGAKIELFDEEEKLIGSDYGYAYYSFRAAGTYSIVITATDGTTKEYTLNVFGEFLPLMRATYGETVLVIDIDMDNGVQKGNMDMFYGITVNENNTPAGVIEVLEQTEMLAPNGIMMGMYFAGYLPTAKDLQTDTITLNVVTLLGEGEVLDHELNPIADYANAELTILTDAIHGKYAVVYASTEGMIVPVIFYLKEKVWPLQITLGEGENTVTLNYQFDMDMDNGSGNMYFGNFVMDMNAGGMVTTISAADIGLTGTITELDAILTFAEVPTDASYVVISEDFESSYMPTDASNLSVPATFTIADEGTAYVITFYVCMPGSTLDDPMPLPLIITVTK